MLIIFTEQNYLGKKIITSSTDNCVSSFHSTVCFYPSSTSAWRRSLCRSTPCTTAVLLWQKNTLGRIRIPKLEISIQPNGCKEFETVKCALILKSPDSWSWEENERLNYLGKWIENTYKLPVKKLSYGQHFLLTCSFIKPEFCFGNLQRKCFGLCTRVKICIKKLHRASHEFWFCLCSRLGAFGSQLSLFSLPLS